MRRFTSCAGDDGAQASLRFDLLPAVLSRSRKQHGTSWLVSKKLRAHMSAQQRDNGSVLCGASRRRGAPFSRPKAQVLPISMRNTRTKLLIVV